MKIRVVVEGVVESSDMGQTASNVQNLIANLHNTGYQYVNWAKPMRVVKLEALPEPEVPA